MYNIKSVNNPRNKKGDKNRKKGDENKSENKNDNNTGTAGAHVGETTTPQDSSASSNGSSIGTHVSEVAKPSSWLTWSIQDILATHAINDPIWDFTNAYNFSTDTINSAEALAGSHIAKQVPEYILCRPKPMEVCTIYMYVQPDSNKDEGLYQFMDKHNK